ncbi:ATP-binding protein [Funiculus sociatus GB2-A5]|uniref:ATP-binding protein n=1 Tax=Funiculus sociatus GB2-A5 TaxID=2933946 RepID=A0ABV0JTZ8_9CYAN|nr:MULTISPECIES: ATP-binding protein [unclassified Trichocoleus]MBD1905466.1 ATP-binding protein [Trichocoleus sp. FACHB-832]MBD2062323.1 ATP-binding protein [Trichocoleus sp. FACHB-6]
MFDPTKLDVILTIQDKDLLLFPSAEDERHEYKSSTTKDSELADKIARTASGFWNNGGGLFVAGVNDKGQPDGGLSLHVGRQSRRDWIDQAISRVSPRGFYVVHSVEDSGASLNIAAGNAIFLIGFGESEIGPHMAHDNRYYIRSGAHTIPVSHFIVEAIHARRGLRVPLLRHIVRRKPGNSEVIQLGIVTSGTVPAINASIELDPLPTWLQARSGEKFPLQVSIISEQFPFFFDIHIITMGEEYRPSFSVNLTYFDIAYREHEHIFEVDIDRQMGPNLKSEKGTERIEKEIGEIKKVINKELGDIKKEISKVAENIKNKRGG